MIPGTSHSAPNGYSLNLVEKYHYYQNTGNYDRVVLVPGPKLQQPMSSHHRPFHRQPTEHPNGNIDRPEHSYASGEPSGLSDSVKNLQLDHGQTTGPTQNESYKRVMDWNDEPSFVIDGSMTDLNSEIDSVSGHDYHRSVSEQGSSDDDTGLQKSMQGIQHPPAMMSDNPSMRSRPSSGGSASSIDSSLSFHTVYPSGGFSKPKPKPAENQLPPPQRRPMAHASIPSHSQSQNAAGTVPKLPPTVSTEPYSGQSQAQAERPRMTGHTRVQQINNEASREASTSVFITYAEEQENPGFRRLVLQLTKTLLSNGVQVRLDMLESTLMSMSVSSWLDDNIQKCDFVIVCVSPSYKSEVEQQVPAETHDPHSLHTRYIYSRLHTEYIQNGSRNYRFIPVLIGGATRRDLPSWCLDTNVYEWPKHYESIIYRLFRKEKYIQPRVGPPPKCTVEAYGTHDESNNGPGQ